MMTEVRPENASITETVGVVTRGEGDRTHSGALLRVSVGLILFALLSNSSAGGKKYPLTRAEQSNFTETSRYSDVVDFIAELQRDGAKFGLEYFGTTVEGKRLPLAIFSDPQVVTPSDARRLGKPVVFVMANIHAGEVEGKEAAQIIMREIVEGKLSFLLKHMVLLVAPIYNADGNDKISIFNRTDQNGPYGGVGTRSNAQGLDLNRDYMKLESPEAQGLVENIFDRWDPDVFIDLHTTDGSYHGYALTYSGPLNPNTDSKIQTFENKVLFPEVSRILVNEDRYRTYFYGDFVPQDDPYGYFNPDSSLSRKAWATFDERPRFGTNYLGLRNRLTVLSEAYSHLDFRTRVDVTRKFVEALLRFVYSHNKEILSLTDEADEYSTRTGLTCGNEKGYGLQFKFVPSVHDVTILEGGVRKILDDRTGKYRIEATGKVKAVKMKEYETFAATKRRMPPAAYIVPAGENDVVRLLRMHGISVMKTESDTIARVEEYVVTEMNHDSTAFQKHRETTMTIAATDTTVPIPKGSFVVSTHQPEAALIFYLLEPDTDDGLTVWNFFDAEVGREEASHSIPIYPVYRINNQLHVPMSLVE